MHLVAYASIGLHSLQVVGPILGQDEELGVEDLPLEIDRRFGLTWQNTAHLEKYRSCTPVSHTQIRIHTYTYTDVKGNRSLRGGSSCRTGRGSG